LRWILVHLQGAPMGAYCLYVTFGATPKTGQKANKIVDLFNSEALSVFYSIFVQIPNPVAFESIPPVFARKPLATFRINRILCNWHVRQDVIIRLSGSGFTLALASPPACKAYKAYGLEAGS
jgi:hypothetical protein